MKLIKLRGYELLFYRHKDLQTKLKGIKLKEYKI